MALINIALASNSTTTLDENNVSNGDVVAINSLGNQSTLLVDDVNVRITSIAGVAAGSSPTFASTNHGTLTLNQGLLNIQALSGLNFDVIGAGNIVLEGSTVTTGLNNLLSSYNVNFEGNKVGTFLYKPPAVALLNPTSFNVTGMQAGDQFDIGAGRSWSLVPTTTNQPKTAYHDGFLNLTSKGGLLDQTVNVKIPMTQTQANMFFASQAQYLNPSTGVFIFPGEIVCFAQGTLLLTTDGYRSVEDLFAGDELLLADGRHERIRWIGSSLLNAIALDLLPNLLPIRLRKDCLAKGYPFADLIVSPQHRIWVNGDAILDHTDGVGGLIAAKHLLGIDGVEVAKNIESVRYYHVLMDSHELLLSNGVATESLLIGKHISQCMAPALRSRIIRDVPDAERYFNGEEHKSRYNLLQGKTARQLNKLNTHHAKSYFDAVRFGLMGAEVATCT